MKRKVKKSDCQQFHRYQQNKQPPLNSNNWSSWNL